MVMLLKNKRGSEMILPPLMFIVLNIVFFSVLLVFVVKASTGALVYEQAYAKQVALLIDEAKSDMQILVDFEEGVEVAKKNKKTSGLVKIDNKTNQVVVSLGSKGGYSYKYFSDYEVNAYEVVEDNLIIINIGDKVWEKPERPADFDKEVSDEELKEAVGKSDCGAYSEWIDYYAKKYDVSPILVLAIIMEESNCNPTGQNINYKLVGGIRKVDSYDVGLMQVNTKVHCGAKDLSMAINTCKEQLKDPEINIKTGVLILLENYKSFKDGRLFKEACSAEYKKKTYYGWQAALRGYNGWGCYSGGGINSDLYVEKINKKFASLGGDSSVV